MNPVERIIMVGHVISSNFLASGRNAEGVEGNSSSIYADKVVPLLDDFYP